MKLKTNTVVVGVFLLLGLLSSLSRADSLTLRDGRHLQGKFAGGTQGVIAFSVGGATQYYEVSNVLVMTFEPAEGSDAPGSSGQQPSIVPDPGSLQRQKLQGKTGGADLKAVEKKSQQKRPVRLIMAAQRSE
jgi:hypothetical protein